MDNDQGHAWNVSKEKLIREIKSTYEAILKFREEPIKNEQELQALSMEDLSEELQTRTDLLDTLVNEWDIRT